MLLTGSPEAIQSRGPCVLVPTMGALHEGHKALIRQGADLAEAQNAPGGCVVTIFVNPTQFNDPADFARYPKTLEADAQLCREAGAAAVFAPEVGTVYPPNEPPPVPPLPEVATRPGLEDAFRPGHFAGVCQVVHRLFDLCKPSAAVFGEKDWQQLQVIRAMAREQNLPIEIVSSPTIREPDGLARSSRNRFIPEADRRAATAISQALHLAGEQRSPAEAETAMNRHLQAASVAVEYAVVRDAQTLLAPAADRPCRSLIAARLGPVRLIDNMPWPDASRSSASAG